MRPTGDSPAEIYPNGWRFIIPAFGKVLGSEMVPTTRSLMHNLCSYCSSARSLGVASGELMNAFIL
jgi:hypothetical protein